MGGFIKLVPFGEPSAFPILSQNQAMCIAVAALVAALMFVHTWLDKDLP